MKLKELMEKMPELRDKKRMPLRSLMKMLTPISVHAIMTFQEIGWDHSRPYEEFVVAQNAVIKDLVTWELSEEGQGVRKKMNLPPLTDETEIPDIPVVTAIVRKTSTDDGLMEMEDDVEIGKDYMVDLSSIGTIECLNVEKGVRHNKTVIMEIEAGKWLPVELLYIPGYTL